MNQIELALDVARRAHAGQVDKLGSSYIFHPLRVAARAGFPYFDDESLIIGALLHDVIEDTEVTADDMRGLGFSEEVVDAVVAITKRRGESNDDYYLRVKDNPLAHAVKLADIADNSDERRLAKLDPETADRLRRKYAHALEMLS